MSDNKSSTSKEYDSKRSSSVGQFSNDGEDHEFSKDFKNDFKNITYLGKGAYGHVYKATRIFDGKIYALKCTNFRNY